MGPHHVPTRMAAEKGLTIPSVAKTWNNRNSGTVGGSRKRHNHSGRLFGSFVTRSKYAYPSPSSFTSG